MNRIENGIARCKAKLAERLESGIITKSDVATLHKQLDMEVGEYVRFQELKSIASVEGKLSLDEAQTVYGFLGNTPDHFNRQPVEVKVVLTEVFAKLLK
jgi:hypothetical protein